MASGPRVKLFGYKSALTPPPAPFPGTDRSKDVVQVLVLLFVALWIILALCYFVLVFFSPFSIAITSLGEERANLIAFRTFVRFALVWFCLFSLPFGVLEGLRLVIVALPGFFYYLFCIYCFSLSHLNHIPTFRFGLPYVLLQAHWYGSLLNVCQSTD